jgi:hypothetical protein
MSEVQERPTESTALVAVKSALPTIIAADNEDILGKLAKELSGFKPDISTEAGHREIASKARKAATAKMDLIRLAGTLKADHQKVLKGVVAEEKIITERMDGLRDSIRAPLTEFEQREERRIKAHEDALTEIAGWSDIPADAPSADIAARLDELDNSPLLARDWEEFRDRAREVMRQSVGYLRAHHAAAVTREAEAAELTRLRAEAAERERQEAERLRIARETEIARQAAEAARAAAEAEAARKAREVEEAVQREREAAAERERLQAEALARAEREKTEAETRIAAEMARAQVEREQAAQREEQARVAAAEQMRRAALGAEERAKAAAARAEADKLLAAEVAANAERERARREQAAADAAAERRAANVAHRKQINNEALVGILKAIGQTCEGEGATEIGKAITTAISKGSVPHVSIAY